MLPPSCCRPSAARRVAVFALLVAAVCLAAAPAHVSAYGFLWLDAPFKYSNESRQSCQPHVCGVVNTLFRNSSDNSTMSVPTHTANSSFWECYNRTTVEKQPRAYRCRCFAHVLPCLTERANCTDRIAQQLCFDFVFAINVDCSWKLCLGAGGISFAVALALAVAQIALLFA